MGQLGKKILYILGSLFILLIAALFILPPILIGKYKDQIVEIAQEQTGRNVQIEGISARLLPNAQVILKNVVIPSVEGSSSKDLLTAQSFRVKIGLLPLLAKTIKVNVVEFEDTKIYAEILPDGSNNWTMAFMEASPTGEPTPVSQPQNASENKKTMGIKLDKAQLKNSHILFVNRMPGKNVGLLQEVKNVNIEASAKDLAQGPYALNGNFIWNDLPFDINVKTGALGTEKTTIDMDVKIEKQHGIQFDGELTLQPDFSFTSLAGQAHISSQNPAQLTEVLLGETMGLPHIPIDVAVKLETTDQKGNIDKGKITIGKSQIDFEALWNIDDIISANMKIRGKNVNVDEILASLSAQTNMAEKTASSPAASPSSSEVASVQNFKLPENINASLDAQIQNVIYNKEAVSNVILQAKLEGGILQVPQVSAVLPGNSPIGANMVIKNSDPAPYADGNFSFKSPALKDLIAWLGGDVSAIPQNRLNQLDFRSNIAGSLDNISLSNLDGKVDDMHIQGSLGVRLKNRMAVLTDLSIDKLDLNPWLAAFAPAEVKTSYNLGTDILIAKAHAAGANQPLVPIDADIKLYIGQLIYQNIIASEIQTNLTIKDDNLNIHHANIGNIEGAKISATGQIHDLGGSQKAIDLTTSLNANSIAKLLQIAQIKDIPADKIGAVSAKAVINGSLKGLISLNATANAMGGTYNAAGQFNVNDIQNINQLHFQVKHNNLNQVMAVFSPATQIPKGFRSVDVKGDAAVNGKIYKISKFSGTVGQSQIKSAQMTADLSASKPQLQINLNAAMLNLDSLTEGDGAKTSEQKQAQAAKRKPGTPPWTDDKIDLSALNSLNLDADISADNMKISGKNLSNVKLKASIKDGLLDVPNLSAVAYGGNMSATAKINGKQTPKINASLNISSLNLNQLSKDMAGIKLPIGRLNMQSNLDMSGSTSRQMVNSLNGKGSVKVAGLGAQQSGSEFDAFLGVLQKVASIGQAGILDIASDFTIAKGIVNLNNLQISGPIGGNAKGNINLPNWTLDIKGAFTLLDGGASKLVLAALGKQNMTESHDFRVHGSIDAPQMDLPSDLQKAFNLYKAANDKDIKALISNGVSADLLKKLGVSDKDSALINGLIGSFGGNNKTAQPKDKPATPNNQDKNPASGVTDKAIDEILGKDNPLGDAAKGIVNEEAGKLFKKIF